MILTALDESTVTVAGNLLIGTLHVLAQSLQIRAVWEL